MKLFFSFHVLNFPAFSSWSSSSIIQKGGKFRNNFSPSVPYHIVPYYILPNLLIQCSKKIIRILMKLGTYYLWHNLLYLDKNFIYFSYYREMEIRRRKKDEKNKALEQQIQDMKRKAKESEDWQSKKNFFIEKMVPFCVGLAMLIAGTVYYMRS